MGLPFFVNSLIIWKLGAEYAGIRGLFSSVLQVLNLAELGVGSAIVYSMYKPIAEDDLPTICALFALYKKVYKLIGFVILILGLTLVPFVRTIITGNVPADVNIYAIFLIYIFNTVLSYWLFAYKSALLNAYQRVDVINYISSITTALMNIVQLLILVYWQSFYAYLMAMVVFTIINNLMVSYNVNRLFPNIECTGTVKPDLVRDIKKKIYGLIIGKVCGITRNTLDSIYISAFMGLTMIAIYNNYLMVFMAINSISLIVVQSLQAGIGNKLQLNTEIENLEILRKLNFIYMHLAGWAAICLLNLYQPFIEFWLGPAMMLNMVAVVLLSVYFYVLKMSDMQYMFAEAAGLWWENRFRVIAESLCNIVLNFVLIREYGVCGVIVATALSLLVFGVTGATYIVFKHYFKKGIIIYLKDHLIYMIGTALNAAVTYQFCNWLGDNTIVGLLTKFFVCLTVTPLLFFLLYHRSERFVMSKGWLLRRHFGSVSRISTK